MLVIDREILRVNIVLVRAVSPPNWSFFDLLKENFTYTFRTIDTKLFQRQNLSRRLYIDLAVRELESFTEFSICNSDNT